MQLPTLGGNRALLSTVSVSLYGRQTFDLFNAPPNFCLDRRQEAEPPETDALEKQKPKRNF